MFPLLSLMASSSGIKVATPLLIDSVQVLGFHSKATNCWLSWFNVVSDLGCHVVETLKVLALQKLAGTTIPANEGKNILSGFTDLAAQLSFSCVKLWV